MDNPLGDFRDEAVEQLEGVKKIVKQQVLDNPKPPPTDEKGIPPVKDAKKTKVDPVTGKPIATKKVLTQLSQATTQLAQIRLKKLREDLDKQRLKVSTQKLGDKAQGGPPIPDKPIKKDDAVSQTLKASKETGEFKGLIGG